MEFKKWNINDTPEITIPEMNENFEAIENALKVAELDNLVVNGDFSNGANSWSLIGFEYIGNLEFSLTDTNNATRLQQTIINNVGDLYYVSGDIKPTKLRPSYIHFGGTNTQPLDEGGTIINEWNNVSGVIKTINSNPFRFYHRTDGLYQVGDKISFQDILTINLTQTFGAGNEPSKEFCDAIMEVVGWFDGKYNLTIQEMFIIIAKWSQAQNTNQIMTLPHFETDNESE